MPVSDPDVSRPRLVRDATFLDADRREIPLRRGPHNQLGFAYQVAFVRVLGRFPQQAPLEIDGEILRFAALQLGADAETIHAYAGRQQMVSEHQQRIGEYLRLCAFDAAAGERLARFLEDEALRLERTASLLARARAWLRDEHVLAPADSVLRRAIGAARHKARTLLMQRMAERLDDMLKAQRHAVDRIVQRYRRLGAVLLDPDVGDDELRARLLSTVPEAQLHEDQSDLANWTRGDRKARFEQTAARHAGLSQFAGPFLSRMKFVDEQGEGASPTLSALRAYREHRAAGRRGVPPHAPLDFAPAALQPLIRHNGVTDRRRWESALFLKVRDEIQTGNLAIDGAKNFGRFEAFFLPTAQWERVREAFWARTGFHVDPTAAGEQLKARLSDAFDRFLGGCR